MKTTLRFYVAAIFVISSILTTVAQNPMCMIGDATKYGWDKDKSSPLTQDGINPSKFYYNAYLNVGSFKFLKQNSDWVPSWNMGASNSTVVKRNTLSDPDVSFSNATAGNYAIVLDTAALTLNVTAMSEQTHIPFNTVFMVGGAAPNGWDLGKATELVRNPANPFEFSYTGALAVGEIKFPVNRNWGWNQDFFIKVTDTQMQLVAGGDVKWNITEAANYKVTINTSTLAISIQKQITSVNPAIEQKYPTILTTAVKDDLFVQNLENFEYRILNFTGSTVSTGTSVNAKINVSSLQSGIYFLTIGNKAFKFIKY